MRPVHSVVVILLGDVVLKEVEERLAAVLAGLNGFSSSLRLRLRRLSRVVCSELSSEVAGECRGLGLGRERVRLDSTDVGVLGLHTGQHALCADGG